MTSPVSSYQSSPSTTSQQQRAACVICSGPTNGIWHYGAEGCRACASFFHRSVKANRQYTCRADGNCQISCDEGMRNSCRACRLKKCVQAGMVIDESPSERKTNRRNNGSSNGNVGNNSYYQPKHQHHQRVLRSNGGSAAFFQSSTNSSTNSPAAISTFPPFPLSQSLEAKIPLTLQFEQSIRQFNNGLRALSIVEGIISNECVLAGGTETKLKMLTREEFKRTEKGTLVLAFTFICQQLPAINTFPAETKNKLFRVFAKQFTFINHMEMTMKSLPESNTQYAMLIPGGLVDRNNVKRVMEEPENNGRDNERENSFRFQQSFADRHFDLCIGKYKPLKIQPLEFAALCAIMFWNAVEYSASDQVPAEEYSSNKDALYAELHTIIRESQGNANNVFGENGTDNVVATRFGKLMDLLLQIAVFTWEICEMMTMGKIFMNIPDVCDEICIQQQRQQQL